MKIDERVTAAQLDEQGRRGLESLGASLELDADEKTINRAARTLKILKEGSTRDTNEINRLSVQLKVAKMLGYTAEEQRPFWDRLAGAREVVVAKTPKALAPAPTPSTTSPKKRSAK